jgi:protein TonB
MDPTAVTAGPVGGPGAGHKDSLDELARSQRRIDDSFGLASWVAVIGVLLVWAYLKLDTSTPLADPVSTTSVLSTPLQREQGGMMDLVDRADTAFAAGDIVTPEGDNALHYYQQALEQTPDDAAAARGFEQVIEFLVNEAESAVYLSDWDRARNNAARVLILVPKHKHAQEINRRAARLQQVEELINRAVALYAAGRLTLPADENAAAMYQAALELEPGNESAKQGLESIVQRTIANAESSMYAGNMDQARAYLDRAKAINPDAAGVVTLEKTNVTWENIQESLDIKNDILAAAEALQADRLMPPDQPNAFALYSKVLEQEPGSEAALRGLQLVRNGLLDRARTMLASEDMQATNKHLDAAALAGADAATLADLRDEAAYRQRLIDARAGRFASLYPIKQVTPVRQNPPTFPRSAPAGSSASVNLHLTISESGDVKDVEVINSPPSYFERAAINAVNRWKFEPVMERGRPIPVRVAVKVGFQG